MIVDDYIQPAVLTGFVREVPTPVNLFLNQVLPDRQIGDIEAAIDQVTHTNRAAQFRAWDSETPTARRDSFSRSKVKLPPLGNKLPIGEQERLMLERIRTGGDNRNGYVDAIYNDAEILTSNVLNRMELARADVLIDGKFTLAGENGLTLEADFGLDPAHNVIAGTLWSDKANATPLQNIQTWVNQYVDDTGEMPGRMLTSNTVVNNLLLNAEIRALFHQGNGPTGSPNLITPAQLNQTLEAYGLPKIEQYNTKLEVEGVNQRLIPQDRIIMLPSNPATLGYTAWGITAESLELANEGNGEGLTFEQLPGLVGVVLKEGDPVRVWTKVGAVGMPLITDPRRLFVARVL